jgi:hypothetical protein
MAGMTLNMGLGSSVFASPGYNGAAVPAASGATAQGPTSISQKAFGIVSGDVGCPRTAGIALVSVGTLALVGLAWIWYSLPR